MMRWIQRHTLWTLCAGALLLSACGDASEQDEAQSVNNTAPNNAPNNTPNNAPNNEANNAPNNEVNNTPNNAPNNAPNNEANNAPNNTPNNEANNEANNEPDSGVEPMMDASMEPDVMEERDAQDMNADAAVPGEDVGDGEMDAMVEADTPPDMEGPTCPPEGPFGTEVGEVMPDVSLPDCDGQLHSVRELCSQDAAWLFVFAEWCPACRRSAESFEGVVDQFSGDDVGAFFIISANSNYFLGQNGLMQ